jgi:regulatory protein YycH of two-component signal transduction system YycFG
VNNGQEILTYSNGDNRRMAHNVTTGSINYDAYNVNHNANTLNQRQHEGYRWLVNLHQNSDNLYYFEERDQGQTLTYRLFVNGLPIFGQTSYGSVQIKQLPNKHARIGMSQYSLRVPLPTDQKNQINIEPMASAMADLESVGVSRNDIEQMAIGYRWQLDPDNQIVTLDPGWYFEQNHVWRSVTDQVKSEQGGH